MARKVKQAREVDGTKGTVLVHVKFRLPADVLQGMREEALGRSGSLSALVVEYFRGTPRRFWLTEKKGETPVPKEKPTVAPLALVSEAG